MPSRNPRGTTRTSTRSTCPGTASKPSWACATSCNPSVGQPASDAGRLPRNIPLNVLRPVSTLVWLVFVAMLALGCARQHPGPPNLPVPTPSTTVGPGDMFEVSVLGEKDLPKEYRGQPGGTVEFPYVDRLIVGGLEPQQIEELIKKAL